MGVYKKKKLQEDNFLCTSAAKWWKRPVLFFSYFISYTLCANCNWNIPLSFNTKNLYTFFFFSYINLNWLLRNFIDGKMRMEERMNKIKKRVKNAPLKVMRYWMKKKAFKEFLQVVFLRFLLSYIFKEIWTKRKLRENHFHYCHLSRFLMIFRNF